MISAALAILKTDEQRNELSEFYEKNKKRFYAIAFLKLHNREAAEDAVQEAFLQIADKPDVFFSLSGAKRIHYMCAVARNVSVDMFNKNKTLRTEELSDNIIYRDDENPIENSLFDNISRKEIIDFIGTLPDSQRAVLVLSYSAGLSADEIGAALKISVSAVYRRLYSARKSVKQFIDERSRSDV